MFPRPENTSKSQGRARFGAVAGLAAALAWLIGHSAPVRLIENTFYDWRATAFSPIAPGQVVLVGIDEDTFQHIRQLYPERPWRSPLNKDYLAALLAHIDAGQPRAIGLDVLLDEWITPDERDVFIARAGQLRTPLAAISLAVSSDDPAAQPFAGPHWTDPSVLAEDFDRIVRRHDPAPEALPSLAAQLAQINGVDPPQAPFAIRYYRPQTPGAAAFITISAPDALAAPSRLFAGKTVLIGRIDLAPGDGRALDPMAIATREDLHMTPLRFDPRTADGTPGVEIHAHAMANMINAHALHQTPLMGQVVLLVLAALAGAACAARVDRWIVSGVFLAGIIAAIGAIAAFAMIALSTVTPVATPALAALGAFLLIARDSAQREKQARQHLHTAFGRYVAPAVIDRAVETPGDLSLTPQVRAVSYLVTDLERFSDFVAGTPPALFAKIMNGYFETLVEVLWTHEATVDKLVGDAVYAFFGAPGAQPDHAARAIACARALDAAAQRFRETVRRDHAISLGVTRIGVATGPALVGNFGGARRVNYTAYSDTVVIAARLQDANKQFNTRLLLAKSVIDAAKDDRAKLSVDLDLTRIGPVSLKGVSDPVEAFTLATHKSRSSSAPHSA